MRFSLAALLLLLASSKNDVVVGQGWCEPGCYCVPELGDPCPVDTGLPIDPDTGLPKLLFAAAYFSIPGFTDFLKNLFLANPPTDTLDCQPYPLLQKEIKKDKETSNKSEKCKKPHGDDDSDSDDGDDKVCVYQYNPSDLCTATPSYTMTTKERSEVDPSLLQFITHEGTCGVCSNAADLANVWFNPILNGVAYFCSRTGGDLFDRGYPLNVALGAATTCFTNFGFSDDCAHLWASNALNSVFAGCTDACIAWLGDITDPTDLLDITNPAVQALLFSANDPTTCELHECLACDEEESGEIFKEYSGRTRRNSGILTVVPIPPSGLFAGLKRPCDSIADIFQVYPQAQICQPP
jgi:hypothetical protein